MSFTAIFYIILALLYAFLALREDWGPGRPGAAIRFLAVGSQLLFGVLYLLKASTEASHFGISIFGWISDSALLIMSTILAISGLITVARAIYALYFSDAAVSKIRVLGYTVISVAMFIISYAILYSELSRIDQNSFNLVDDNKQKIKLDLLTGLYFSIVTFATVGYGDIYPVSNTARMFVSSEILFSLAFTVAVFSVIASFIRQK
jgi:hypothetical protein